MYKSLLNLIGYIFPLCAFRLLEKTESTESHCVPFHLVMPHVFGLS